MMAGIPLVTTSLWYFYCELWTDFTHCCGVSIVDFEQVTDGWDSSSNWTKTKMELLKKIMIKINNGDTNRMVLDLTVKIRGMS